MLEGFLDHVMNSPLSCFSCFISSPPAVYYLSWWCIFKSICVFADLSIPTLLLALLIYAQMVPSMCPVLRGWDHPSN